MADFRRWFTVLAVLALAAGLASAQVGTAGTGVAGALTCTANGASIPQVRVEGYTELMGDILITCTGGSMIASGTATQIPTTNITVYMTPSNPITSRLMASSGGLSESVLIIDEPGSGLATPVTGLFGPKAPDTLCSGTTGGCPAYVGVDGSGNEVAVNAPAGTVTAANIYQGYLGAYGVNTVTFYGVPVLPPVTTGLSRIFRITNIRYPVNGISNQSEVLANVSTSPSQILPLTQSSFPVAVVIAPSLSASVALSSANPFAQCYAPGITQAATLTYAEKLATAFKTRVVPLANTLYAAETANTSAQNIPGGLYGQFALNSESGFIVPGYIYGNYTAGLADYGTRLKAVFTNIPAGITLYVSTVSLNAAPVAPAVVGGQTLLNSYAVLVGTGTGEATPDPATGFAPVPSTATAGTVPVIALAQNSSGQATAVWEVTNSEPAALDTLTFGVYINYTPAPGTTTPTNPYGLPQVTVLPGFGGNNVSMSYAPEPSQGAFSAATAANPSSTVVPRFAVYQTAGGPFVAINLCQTTLLYPFVTANPNGSGLGQGFDTGLAVANTSSDPFGTKPYPLANTTTATPETGSCTLYPYGTTYTATGTGAAPAVLPGCDTISSLPTGSNCFPIVKPGQVQTVSVYQIWPGFQGYVIAVCNFQYAHGYAAVTDLGLRGLFSSYIALELAPNSFGSAGRGVSIEQLVH